VSCSPGAKFVVYDCFVYLFDNKTANKPLTLLYIQKKETHRHMETMPDLFELTF